MNHISALLQLFHGVHSTQKPLALSIIIINLSSEEGDTVADFYMGSGTTIVAANALGRKYIGCDVSQIAYRITSNIGYHLHKISLIRSVPKRIYLCTWVCQLNQLITPRSKVVLAGDYRER